MLSLPSYVLITPARNEAQFIELTVKSVVAQTVRPLKWIIVSDGSTDGTDDIVTKYAAEHDWIELVRMRERRERHFAGKVHAFNAGYARVKDLKYEVIGSLDGDISFDEDHFSYLLRKLAENATLGLVLSLCEHRARVWLLPTISTAVLRRYWRIQASEKRWCRSYCGPHGKDERLEDTNFYRQDLSASSKNRNGSARHIGGQV